MTPATIALSVLPRCGRTRSNSGAVTGSRRWGDEVTEQPPAAERPRRVPLHVVVSAGGELDPDDLAGVLEAMPAAFFFLDCQWRFRYVNAAMDRLLHLPREELLGRTIWGVYTRMVGSRFDSAYRDAVASGHPVAFEAPYSGELPGWYEVRAWPRPDGLAVYFLDVTARHTAEESARRSGARLALLAQVNAELSGALDSVSALGRLARIVVPTLTDAAIVTVVDRDGRARDVGSRAADPGKRDLLARYARIRLETLPPTSPVALALTAGTEVDEPVAEVLALMPPGAARDLLEELGPERASVLPLPALDRTVGVLTLYHDAGRVVGPQDVETAREVAAAAGRAIDRVHRQSQQAPLAEAPQRSLLPETPGLPHAEFVVRYVPAAEAARVGGDWYDAFLQRDGTPVVVIGDVVGHDTAAAASMGQLRGLLRGIAHHSGAGPAEVLRGLDEAIASMHRDALASAAVARFEGLPGTDGSTLMRWANAGQGGRHVEALGDGRAPPAARTHPGPGGHAPRRPARRPDAGRGRHHRAAG